MSYKSSTTFGRVRWEELKVKRKTTELLSYKLKTLPVTKQDGGVLITEGGGSSSPPGYSFEGITACEGKLVVGTSEGQLLLLSPSPSTTTTSGTTSDTESIPPFQLSKVVTVTRGYKIDKLTYHRPTRRLLVLAASTLRFYHLNLEPVEGLSPIKGVTSFSLDPRHSDSPGLLTIAKRRSLLLYHYDGSEVTLVKELNWIDPILNVGCNSTTICLADTSQFWLIDRGTYRRTSLFSPSIPPPKSSRSIIYKPSILLVDEDEFLIVLPSGDDSAMGMFVSSMAVAVRGTITWDNYPIYVASEFPFTLALTKANHLVIHNFLSQSLVQAIHLGPQDKVKCLVDGAEIKQFLPTLDTKLNPEGSEGDIYATLIASVLICTENSIGAFFHNSIVEQADKVLDSRKVEMAVLMADEASAMLSEQSPHFHRISRELQYIYQKCGLIYLEQTLLDDASFLLQRGKLDPRVLISFFPDIRDPLPEGRPPSQIYQGLALYPGIERLASQMDNIHDIVKKSLYGDQSIDSHQDLAVAALISNAKEMVIQFLKDTKVRRSGRDPTLNLDQLKAVDTALFKLYAETDTTQLPSLLQSDHHCDLDACLEFVRESKNFYVESLIYKNRAQPDQVFALWMRLYDEQTGVREADVSSTFRLSLEEIVDYLCLQTEEVLVKRVTDWLLTKDPLLAAQTLTRFPVELSRSFNTTEIIATLEASLSNASSTQEPTGLEIYLEDLILNRGNEDPDLHFKLGETYIDLLLTNGSQSLSHQSQLAQMDHSFLVVRSIRPRITFLSFLESRNDRLSRRRFKLVQFLLRTTVVALPDFVALLTRRGEHFLFESAILHSKMGDHQQALQHLIQLQDFTGAEGYCTNLGKVAAPQAPLNPSPTPCSELLNLLLRLYLAGDDEQKMALQVKSLLEHFEGDFQALEVLDLLPSHWSLETFAPFLARCLQRLFHHRTELQIVKGLAISENIEVNVHLATLRSRATPTLIDTQSTCQTCHQPITTQHPVTVGLGPQSPLYHPSCHTPITTTITSTKVPPC